MSDQRANSCNRRVSFNEQLSQRSLRIIELEKSTLKEEDEKELWEESEDAVCVTLPFESKFDPDEMRQLALVAHNHMKPAMKDFIQTYSEVLKKFRITGTQTTMRMCRTLWGVDDPEIKYGLTCTSGPLGGDAQLAALMCVEDLGALIFFVDPLSAHPHQADIDSLIRLSNCGNVIVCPNPTSAMSMMHTLKRALEKGKRGMIPSFFETLESPAVAEYKRQQEFALAAAITGKPQTAPLLTDSMVTAKLTDSMVTAKYGETSKYNLSGYDMGADYNSDDSDDDEGYKEFLLSISLSPGKFLDQVQEVQKKSIPLKHQAGRMEPIRRESESSVTRVYGMKRVKRSSPPMRLMKKWARV